MKWLAIIILCALASCKKPQEEEKEFVTPEEKKVLDEMSRSYKKY